MWICKLCFCRFDPFDSCVFLDWNFYETVRTCCDSHSFTDFETFSLIQKQFWLGLGFGSNGSDPPRIHIDSDLVLISWWGMVRFWCYLRLSLEFWTVSFDSWLGILPGELVSLLFFLSPIRILWNPLLLLPSSSPIQSLHSRLQRAASGGVLALDCWLNNSVMKIHANLWELFEFAWICALFDAGHWIQWWILLFLVWNWSELVLNLI